MSEKPPDTTERKRGKEIKEEKENGGGGGVEGVEGTKTKIDMERVCESWLLSTSSMKIWVSSVTAFCRKGLTASLTDERPGDKAYDQEYGHENLEIEGYLV